MNSQTRIGFLCSPVPGHLIPTTTVMNGLSERGFSCVLFTTEDGAKFVANRGVRAEIFARKDFPAGSFGSHWGPLAGKTGPAVAMGTVAIHKKIARAACEELPEKIRELGLTHLIVDHVQFQGRAIAEAAGLPFLSLACAVHFSPVRDDGYPPASSLWKAGGEFWKPFANRVASAILSWSQRPVLEEGNRLLRKLGRPPVRQIEDSFSSAGYLSMMPRCLDFPRTNWPAWFRDVRNPLSAPRAGSTVDLDELADGRPIVYVSMGTLQTNLKTVLGEIEKLPAQDPSRQYFFSRGKWTGGENQIDRGPHGEIHADFLPQLDVLKRASLMITHAGTNSVYECLYFGVPVLCLPVGNDQPTIADRVSLHEFGISIPPRKATAKRLLDAVLKVTGDDRFRARLGKAGEDYQRQPLAADVVAEWLAKS